MKIMSLFVKQNFHGLNMFIWIVCILTLSMNNVVKTDSTTPSKPGLNASFTNAPSKYEYQTSSSLVHATSESVYSTKKLNNNVGIPLVAGEGGPISITSTIQDTTSTAPYLISTSNSLNMQSNSPKGDKNILNSEIKNNTNILWRKGSNKILDNKQENAANVAISPFNDTKPIVQSSSVPNTFLNNKEHTDINVKNLTSHISTINSVVNSTDLLQEKLLKSTTVTASSVQEHKPKPTATVVGPNSDKQEFILHTKGSHLRTSKKIDYVLPVIVTLITLPILGAIIFMVYKQGRDCWDKRHYRRMDFLIDGMYND